MEIRSIQSKIRSVDDAGVKKLIGTVPFNSQSELLSDPSTAEINFYEVIKPNAFVWQEVRALINHCAYPVLARTANETLVLNQNDEGLQIEVSLPPTSAANDLWISVQRGDISGVSFRFAVNASGEEWNFGVNPPIHTLTSITIDEVSFCGQPAYTESSASARSLKEAALLRAEKTREEIELELLKISIQEQYIK